MSVEQEPAGESVIHRIFDNMMRVLRRAFVSDSDHSISLDCYQSLYELSPDGMLVTDGAKIVSVNDAMLHMLGYSDKSELIGHDVHEFTPPSMQGRFANIYKLDATGPYVMELCHKDGGLILVESTGRNVFEFGRKLRVAVVHNLTASKKGVEPSAFEQSEKRFNKVFNASPSILSITTVRDGVFLEVNKAWEKVIGIEREYALGRSAVDLGVWHSLEARARFVEKIGREGFVKDFVCKFNGRGGRVFEMSISAEPITFDGTECMILSGFDVTDRSRADDAVAKMRIEMERADDLQSKFLANMSHELRVPLNTIVGFSSGLVDGIWGRLEDSRHKAYMEAIRTSGQSLVAMVDDLLDMARLESGNFPLHKETTEMGSVLQASVQELGDVFRESGIELDVSLGVDIPPVVVDQTRTKQALKNVLLHARRYTPKGGEVHIHLYESMGMLMIVIEDNGVGISENNVDSVFEPFSTNLVAHEDEGRDGSRLSMPLAKALIEAQGGQIELRSTFGEGTRVAISLPILDLSTSHAD